MYPPGHVGLTALLFAPLVCWFRLRNRPHAGTECLGVALVLAVLPDIDKLLPGLVHRGVTHTLLAAVVAGVVVALLFCSVDSPGLGAEHPLVCYLVGAAGVVSHLAGDVVTPMGIELLYPGPRTVYSLEVVRAGSPAANLLLVVAGTVALVYSHGVPVHSPTDGGETEDTTPAGGLSGRR